MHRQVTAVPYGQAQKKSSKRRLWSDDLDLSPEDQARDLDAYLAVDPWADEVKPAIYQVGAFVLRVARRFAWRIRAVNFLSSRKHRVLLVMCCAPYPTGDACAAK